MAAQRLDKIIASTGRWSRREVKDLVRQGRVTVDDVPARSAEEKVDPEQAVIAVNGEKLNWRRYTWVMLNKPAGYLSATEDGRGATVLDLLPQDLQRQGLFPVGRLDKDTEGLLLITNDGALSHDLLAPGKHVWKTYFVRVQGILEDKDIERLENGMDIGDDRMTLPAKVKRLDAVSLSLSADDPGYPGDTESCLELSICEGRFHQVKRMLAGVGHPVLYLKRLSMGSLRLDEALKQGEYRRLTPEEIAALQKK